MNKKAMEIQYVVALLLALGAAAVAIVFLVKVQNVQPPFQQTDFCAATSTTWTEYENKIKIANQEQKVVIKQEMLSCFPTREQEIARLT